MELELNYCNKCSNAFLGLECPYCHTSQLCSSSLKNIESCEFIFTPTGLAELDTVLSGGIVDGANILLVGSPGSGKSTLVLQIISALCKKSGVIYFSLEEDVISIKNRTNRLELRLDDIILSSMCELYEISQQIETSGCNVVVIDSLQMIYVPGKSPFSSASGRFALNYLVTKFPDKTFIVISCMNKSGKVAGSRMLEHMVDVVVYIENERGRMRNITTSKNRFGQAGIKCSVDMTDKGFV